MNKNGKKKNKPKKQSFTSAGGNHRCPEVTGFFPWTRFFKPFAPKIQKASPYRFFAALFFLMISRYFSWTTQRISARNWRRCRSVFILQLLRSPLAPLMLRLRGARRPPTSSPPSPPSLLPLAPANPQRPRLRERRVHWSVRPRANNPP